MKRQGGGTILGFIIGVVVGLGAALTVAVYVTKVPVPFLNKALSRTAEHDAAETKKNKDWDPNAPLYGKNPARPPAASGAVGTAAPVAAAPEATAPKNATVTAVPPQPVKAEPKPAAAAAAPSDPLGDLAKARVGSVAGPDPFDYFVQAGAFRSAEDAEAQRAKLAIMGWEAKVTEREQAGRTVFRVRIGPYGKKDDADRTKDKLDTAGLETALVRVQR